MRINRQAQKRFSKNRLSIVLTNDANAEDTTSKNATDESTNKMMHEDGICNNNNDRDIVNNDDENNNCNDNNYTSSNTKIEDDENKNDSVAFTSAELTPIETNKNADMSLSCFFQHSLSSVSLNSSLFLSHETLLCLDEHFYLHAANLFNRSNKNNKMFMTMIAC